MKTATARLLLRKGSHDETSPLLRNAPSTLFMIVDFYLLLYYENLCLKGFKVCLAET